MNIYSLPERHAVAADEAFPELKGVHPYNHDEHQRRKHNFGLSPAEQIAMGGGSGQIAVVVEDDLGTVVSDDSGTVVGS